MGILKTNNEQITLMDTVQKYICVNIRKNIDPLKMNKNYMQANAKKQNVRMGDLNLRGSPMLVIFLGNYHLFLINSVLT